MHYKSIKLNDIYSLDTEAELDFYQVEWNIVRPEFDDKKPCILILPGGGYNSCSEREGEPVALAFLAQGFNCFVLKYRVNKPYPISHIDVGLAIKYIKSHANEYNLLSDDVTVLGFSAGGHLAASYAYLYPEIAKIIGVELSSLRPFALVLGYPVVTTKNDLTHLPTRRIVTGEDPLLIDLLSIENHIDKDFPPTYVFHTKEDQCVSYKNSLLLVEQLKKNSINHRFDLFEKGIHGISVSSNAVYQRNFVKDNQYLFENSVWVINASKFIYEIINEKHL